MSAAGGTPTLVLPGEPPRPSQTIWLITFTDLVGLLLAFFVMIFAMSTVDETRFRQLTGAEDLDRAPLPGAIEATILDERNAPQETPELGHDLGYLATLLREQLDRTASLGGVMLRQDGSQIILSLPAELLFAPNGAEPTEEGAQALFALVGLLRNLGNRIEVEGHADPNPPAADRYPSNWELSLARAAAVALRLEAAGYRQPVLARGRSAARYDEIAESLPARERDALARRVDIIVHEDVN